MNLKIETVSLTSDASRMDTFVARPEAKKAPALILFQEAFGVNDHIKDVAQRLAQEGYVVAAPELFHRTAPPGFTAPYGDFSVIMPHFQAVTTDAVADDARIVFDWLRNDSQVDSSHIGAIGFCLGGRCSFIANGKLPIQAAVSFYGGGIAQALDLASSQAGPILFFWGGLDQHIGADQRSAIADAMTKAGKPCINVEISDANHAFFNDVRPAYNAVAARHAWALTKSFFEANLKG